VSPLTHGLNFCSACDAGVCLYMSLPLYVCLCVCLSVPVDWLSLVVHMPFMVLYSDIRQGLFYSVLLCFWIIFAGEHMMVGSLLHHINITHQYSTRL